ncbi:PD-(D/E)XK nuclease family protein [Arenibacter algicola]|uniref:PD-(D/E)XK nuclease family protein n=1 Tax=Arenibacter algicola TaxID=616991 RepID=UPI001C06E800|nr:PD-(D/E)XK nuclease family protein [Arenibacter algicola]MBU2905122.1 PD-(D/E)XK nuclease family protein [Arenibacter algicola]
MLKAPNLFNHATSELSQDAFIAWLLEWANPDYKTCDEPLHKMGTSFLKELLATKNIPLSSIQSFKLQTQYHKIDVYLELVIDKVSIGIIIEDKVFTSNHSDQLARYKNIISKKVDKVVPIYFKTGFQHCYNDVKSKEYYQYTVKEFSALLRHGVEQGIQNDIVTSYYNFIAEKEQLFDKAKESFENYKSQPIGEWDWWSCTGFFKDYKPHFRWADWGSVGNNRQPLLAFWFGHRDLSIEDENNTTITLRPYIDMVYSEKNIKINFRVAVKNYPQTNNRNRNKIYSAFKPYLVGAGIKHKKPTFRKAKETMLLAQVTELDDSLIYNDLVALLVNYKNVLDDFIDNQNIIL